MPIEITRICTSLSQTHVYHLKAVISLENECITIFSFWNKREDPPLIPPYRQRSLSACSFFCSVACLLKSKVAKFELCVPQKQCMQQLSTSRMAQVIILGNTTRVHWSYEEKRKKRWKMEKRREKTSLSCVLRHTSVVRTFWISFSKHAVICDYKEYAWVMRRLYKRLLCCYITWPIIKL